RFSEAVPQTEFSFGEVESVLAQRRSKPDLIVFTAAVRVRRKSDFSEAVLRLNLSFGEKERPAFKEASKGVETCYQRSP
ncbi:hypothetical protein TNCV_4888851, partial [Trichonephila clavipes]